MNVVELFNIANKIHNCVQGSMSVGSYFTKLKGLWDEREAICFFPIRTCGSIKEVAVYLETQKTMKFIMGLNWKGLVFPQSRMRPKFQSSL